MLEIYQSLAKNNPHASGKVSVNKFDLISGIESQYYEPQSHVIEINNPAQPMGGSPIDVVVIDELGRPLPQQNVGIPGGGVRVTTLGGAQ